MNIVSITKQTTKAEKGGAILVNYDYIITDDLGQKKAGAGSFGVSAMVAINTFDLGRKEATRAREAMLVEMDRWLERGKILADVSDAALEKECHRRGPYRVWSDDALVDECRRRGITQIRVREMARAMGVPEIQRDPETAASLARQINEHTPVLESAAGTLRRYIRNGSVRILPTAQPGDRITIQGTTFAVVATNGTETDQ